MCGFMKITQCVGEAQDIYCTVQFGENWLAEQITKFNRLKALGDISNTLAFMLQEQF